MARTTVKTYTAEELTTAFLAMLEGGVSAAPAKKGRAAKEEPEEEEDEDDEEGDEEEYEVPSLEEVQAMKIGELREMAVELEFEEQKLKSGILAEFEEKYGDEEEDEEEESDEDEEEDDEEDYTREELEEMELPELKKILKENGVKVPRGADQDTLIDLILEEDEEEDEEESEEEEAEEDEGEAVLSEDDLKKMSLTDLKELTQELEIKVRVPKTANTDSKKRKVYVEAILATADEDEDE